MQEIYDQGPDDIQQTKGQNLRKRRPVHSKQYLNMILGRIGNPMDSILSSCIASLVVVILLVVVVVAVLVVASTAVAVAASFRSNIYLVATVIPNTSACVDLVMQMTLTSKGAVGVLLRGFIIYADC